MIKYYIKICCIFFLCSIISGKIFSQDLLNSKNIAQIKVDELSDADILKFQQQLKASKLSINDAEQIALSKGMPAIEINKLKIRLDLLNANLSNVNNNPTSSANSVNPTIRSYTPVNNQENTPSNNINEKIFGSELFKSNSLSFEPNLHLATPANYVLGPEDAILVNVYGLQEASFNQTISPEGTVYIPTVGVIKLSGLTIEQAIAFLKNKMSQIGYRSLRSGASKISVSLTKIRSIQITILGAVKSGSYTISSLATLFNVLYISGGPGENKSFRKIELIRDNKIFKIIDLYHFLMTGEESDNLSLKDNDIIRLPVYQTRVEIQGEVKRPGIFELLPNESLADLLKYSSGFTDSAYRAAVKVIQLTNKERRVRDVDEGNFSSYIPTSGDIIQVSKVLNRFQNRVIIAGAVFRPGIFEITPNLTVGKLIKNAEGLKEDAFTDRGQIVRLKEDNTSEIISFNVIKALKGGADDILLKREDSVIISSVLSLRDKYTVDIEGEVRKPGIFNYEEGLSLKDLIIQAGGFTYAAYPQRIEIARLIRRNVLMDSDPRLSEIINIDNVNDLAIDNKKILLQPFDVITVRKLPGYILPQSVKVTGQVQFPGSYVLSNRAEKVTDLLKRAGGFSPEAYPEGAYLKRANRIDSNQNITDERVKNIENQMRDSTGAITNSVARIYDQIPLDLNDILSNPKSEYNLILKPGDELYIPRNDQEIRISGEVFFPTRSPFIDGKSLIEYINGAGGFTENARRKRVYILYPNGKAVASHHFFFIRRYPKVRPGAEIIVPKANVRKKLSTAETIGISSALASLAGVVIAIIQLTKK